jgi:ferredoxin
MAGYFGRKRKVVPVEIPKLVDKWIEAIVGMCLAHDKDGFDAHDAKAERVEQVIQTAIAKGQLMPTQAAFARKVGMAAGVTPIPPASATFADAAKATGKPAPTEFDVWAAEIAALPADSRFVQKFADGSGGTKTVAPGGRPTGLTQGAMELLNSRALSIQYPRAVERIQKRFQN